MISIRNQSNDPRFNLALEEYVFYHFNPDQEYVILWQNEPSVIVGRNQNTIEEINYKFIKEHNINVVRRMSGGGAVYHDLGNLNYTFIVNSDQDVSSNFSLSPLYPHWQSLVYRLRFRGEMISQLMAENFQEMRSTSQKTGFFITEPYCSTRIYPLCRKLLTKKSTSCSLKG